MKNALPEVKDLSEASAQSVEELNAKLSETAQKLEASKSKYESAKRAGIMDLSSKVIGTARNVFLSALQARYQICLEAQDVVRSLKFNEPDSPDADLGGLDMADAKRALTAIARALQSRHPDPQPLLATGCEWIAASIDTVTQEIDVDKLIEAQGHLTKGLHKLEQYKAAHQVAQQGRAALGVATRDLADELSGLERTARSLVAGL